MNRTQNHRSLNLLLAVLILVFQVFISQVSAWGGLGHRIVARLAEDNLTPEAREAVKGILKGQSMADVANWADAIKKERPETAFFHFISFAPLELCTEPDDHESQGVLVSSLEIFKNQLQGSEADEMQRYEALKFFIHLMGDLSQPLHCAPEGDMGGNQIKVTFMGAETNLHKVWDSEMIKQAGLDEETYLQGLKQLMGSLDLTHVEAGSFKSWAEESNKIARFHSYLLPPDGNLGERYYNDNIRILNIQLIRGAVRLASQLNRIFRMDGNGFISWKGIEGGNFGLKRRIGHDWNKRGDPKTLEGYP